MWPIIKKAVNSDLSTPLNVLIDSVKTVIDTINVNVGSNANASSATGSLHAKVRDVKDFLLILKTVPIASDNVRISADTERTLVEVTDYTKIKEIMIAETGSYRVSFEGKRDPTQSFLQIFVNGVEKGAERSLITTSYQTFTEDIHLNTGDFVQIYGKNSSSEGTVYLKNFKIAWDYSGTEVILD